jgi:hypothetical protein
MFAVTLLNMTTLPSAVLEEVLVTQFPRIIMALAGVLLALWVYQDGENIKMLDRVVVELEHHVEIRKKESIVLTILLR